MALTKITGEGIGTTSGDLTVDVAGDIILDADGGDVTIKDGGTSIGAITNISSDLSIYSLTGNHKGLRFGNGQIVPTNNSGADSDNTTDLGGTSNRFKNLYLSGGAYLGGTGAANYLEDYEEGTWTPEVLNGWGITSPAYSTNTGRYTKIGNLVHIHLKIVLSGGSPNGNRLRIYQLPFGITSSATFTFGGFFNSASSNAENVILLAVENTSNLEFYYKTNTGVSQFTGSHAGSGFNFVFNGIFEVS